MIRYIFRKSKIKIVIFVNAKYTEEEKKTIIEEFHLTPLGGHQGVSRTIKRIKEHHTWKGLKSDVKEYIRSCTSCQMNKSSNRSIQQPMVVTTTAMKPFEKIFLDIVEPVETSLKGNSYILTLQDDLSKHSSAVPIPDHTANTIAQAFVEHFVCLHGIPDSIVTDQGRELSEEYLRHFVEEKKQNWDQYIPYAMFVYNSTTHTAIGFQPHELVYGYSIEVPHTLSRSPQPCYNYEDYTSELRHKLQESFVIARNRLLDKKHKAKMQYDKKQVELNVNVGDKVLLKSHTQTGKLNPKWLGPYEITCLYDNENVSIRRGKKEVYVYKNELKIFNS